MKMINLLLFTGLCITSAVAVFVTAMVLYLLKEAKWESNLNHYSIKEGRVINPQGFEVNAVELLQELLQIEERIAK